MKQSRKQIYLLFALTLSLILIDTYLNIQKITRRLSAEFCNLQQLQVRSESERIPFNNDQVAWIFIPGTQVDYPVMFTPDRNNFYIDHDYDKEFSAHGLPFISPDWSDKSYNQIIYAHNMKDGSMFHDLISFTDQSFFKENQDIYIQYTKEEKEKSYRIYAVVLTDISEKPEFPFYLYSNINDEKLYQSYITLVEKKALYTNLDLNPKYPRKLITLTTCSYHVENGRLCLIAVQMN